MSKADAMLEHIQAFNRARGGGVVVQKVARILAAQRAGRCSDCPAQADW